MTARTTADLTTIGNDDQITITPTRGAPTMTDTTDTEPSGAPRMFGEATELGEPLSRYRRPPLARSIWSGTISFGHIDGNIPHQNR